MRVFRQSRLIVYRWSVVNAQSWVESIWAILIVISTRNTHRMISCNIQRSGEDGENAMYRCRLEWYGEETTNEDRLIAANVTLHCTTETWICTMMHRLMLNRYHIAVNCAITNQSDTTTGIWKGIFRVVYQSTDATEFDDNRKKIANELMRTVSMWVCEFKVRIRLDDIDAWIHDD